MAMQRVVRSPELSNAIFCQTSPEALILVFAVCRDWSTAVTSSKEVAAKFQDQESFTSEHPLLLTLMEYQSSRERILNQSRHTPWLFYTHIARGFTGKLLTARKGYIELFVYQAHDRDTQVQVLTSRRRIIHLIPETRIWTLTWLDERGKVIVERNIGWFSLGGSNLLYEYMTTFYSDCEDVRLYEEPTWPSNWTRLDMRENPDHTTDALSRIGAVPLGDADWIGRNVDFPPTP